MAKFRFKFETVKRIKDRLKSKAQKELAEVNVKIDQKKMKIEEAKQELLQSKLMLRGELTKVAELHFYERHGIYLNSRIKKMHKELEVLEVEKKIRLKELVSKTKESKMFELLQEKHFEKYKEEILKEENTFLDELAIQKSGRK